jgi:hypothetical protein
MPKRRRPPAPIHVLPRGPAAAALAQLSPDARRLERADVADVHEQARQAVTQQTGWEGQGTGPPGLGPEPGLTRAPGGDVISRIVHPALAIFERLFRRLPEESFFSPNVSPSKPLQFDIGSFTVPKHSSLWMFDYEFAVYRFSGIDPNDTVKAEPGRFGGMMGFDLTFSKRRMTNTTYQLDPAPIPFQRGGFELLDVAVQFDDAAAGTFASAASPGTSLLPVRDQVMGARNSPFMIVANPGAVVAMGCVIFRTVTSPIAFIQANMGGYLLHQQVSEALLNRVRPR